MNKLTDLILTAGPSITDREINYVTDAVASGWNSQWAGYINRFQKTFADYLGVSHALTTSSCTGALHLILKALDIKEGDEVIVPELTWIATASAVIYVGATPIFCDVDPESWTMLPESVEKLITPRTKAILPVHLYGHPCDMQPLWDLAARYHLYIVEDAAQSIGATYQGKRTGSLGDAAAFSFQGAKAIVTGEGGMLVTNNQALLEKAYYFGDHGRDPNVSLFNTSIGYKYKMSNLQAALGLAQIERVEEIVAKKRQIFNWYSSRLNNISSLQLNIEKPGSSNIYWMSSIVLDKSISDSRDEFMKKLKDHNIDSRPIFYPISAMPMFTKADNPNAYHVGLRGINLPSGHNLTEEEVDYTCQVIKKLTNKITYLDNRKITLSGWLNFKEDVISKISKIKNESLEINFESQGNLFILQAICYEDLESVNSIELLTEWRKNNQDGFMDQFDVTLTSTKKWLQNLLDKVPDRILFFVKEKNGNFIGHVGLFRFDWKRKTCEIDNIVRGEEGIHKGLMYEACNALINWAKSDLAVETFYLQVLSNNLRAMALYHRLGFVEINRQPLEKILRVNGNTSWQPLYQPDYKTVDCYLVVMQQNKK